MNQILQIKKSKNQHKLINIKDILLLFMIVLIIFDLSVGGYYVYKNIGKPTVPKPPISENPIPEQTKPVINLSVVGSDIKINVTSEIELSKITYKWNSEIEKVENMLTYENRNEFEKKLNIPIGHNTLTIIAEDINGGKTEKTQEIKGVTKATTTTEVKGEYWHFTINGKENIKSVEFEYNGKKFLMNTDTFGNTKMVHYKLKLKQGKNTLKITSTTQSGGVDTTSWNYEYIKK